MQNCKWGRKLIKINICIQIVDNFQGLYNTISYRFGETSLSKWDVFNCSPNKNTSWQGKLLIAPIVSQTTRSRKTDELGRYRENLRSNCLTVCLKTWLLCRFARQKFAARKNSASLFYSDAYRMLLNGAAAVVQLVHYRKVPRSISCTRDLTLGEILLSRSWRTSRMIYRDGSAMHYRVRISSNID